MSVTTLKFFNAYLKGFCFFLLMAITSSNVYIRGPSPGGSVLLVRLAIYRDPTVFTSMAGTVGITAVGMFGKGISGWGLVPVTHALDLIVGSTARKPAVVENRIEPREILDMTVVFDHDVIDGAPATRFTRRLVQLIEGGDGLIEDHTLAILSQEPKTMSETKKLQLT